MSDSDTEEISLTEPEVPEAPAPKKKRLTSEERKLKKKATNAKYYEAVRAKIAEAAKQKEEQPAPKKKAKAAPKPVIPEEEEEDEPAPPPPVPKKRARARTVEAVQAPKRPVRRPRARSPSPISPRTVLRDAYLIMKAQAQERKVEKYRSWLE